METGQLPKTVTDSDALTFLKELLPSFQGSAERIPASHKPLIPAAIRAAKSQLWPARPEEITLALKRLADFADAFHIPSEKLKAAIAIYAEALKHLPADLIDQAITAAMAAHKFGMRLPLPAELIAHVSHDFAQRRTVAAKLEIMDRAPVEARVNPPPTAEEIAKVDELLSKWRRERGPDPAMVDEDEHKAPPDSKDAFFVEPRVEIYEQAKGIIEDAA